MRNLGSSSILDEQYPPTVILDTSVLTSSDINDIKWTISEVKNLPSRDLDHYRTKSKLADLLEKFKNIPFFHDSDQCANEAAADNAIKILHQMNDKRLPKIAVDEDGDIIFAWDMEARNVVLTIEEGLWHFFEKEDANPPNYYDEQSYVNGEIPDFVWERIPAK